MEVIKFQRTLNVVKDEESFNLFTVMFHDRAGNLYSWAPNWDDLQRIFLQACMTEFYNYEDEPLLEGFEDTARRILDQAY